MLVDPLVSAILPVYNVDKYLEKAIGSLENQTYKKMEVIIVDDGSTDSSNEVAQYLVRKYSNITLVTQKNQGAAAARNAGIKKAKGKYLYFMDPDDWMKRSYIESLVKSAEKNHSELVIGGFTNIYYKHAKELHLPVFSNEFNYKDAKEFRKNATVYLNNTMLAVPWNKLYLAKYIQENELWFPRIKWDDLHFNLEVIRNVSRVSISENTGYQFLRNRPGSETTTVFNESLFANRKKQFLHVLEIFQNWNLKDIEKGQLYYYYSSRIVQVVQEIASAESISKLKKRELVKAILNDTTVEEALKRENGGGFIMGLAIAVLKTRNVSSAILLGRIISFVKNKFGLIFLKGKLQV
ncbi:glycosyltransferase family 2 protein [Liquorilactobacillus uvarum]|uniref:glycosyltransferase family 2 protein n=1 Tax=Liquorilactobacillus uvarum TaxID=303240 RepID=UPI002889ACAF|nr:glycosyltransferase family 2 protein [Liquorilactobacillus uvarum]